MDTDFRACSAGPGTPAAARRDDGRHPEIGRPLITCPDRPGIAAVVSSFPFGSGAKATESLRYSTDTFGGTFFLRIEFHRPALTERIGDLPSNSGFAGPFSPPEQNDRPHVIRAARPEAGPAKGGHR